MAVMKLSRGSLLLLLCIAAALLFTGEAPTEPATCAHYTLTVTNAHFHLVMPCNIAAAQARSHEEEARRARAARHLLGKPSQGLVVCLFKASQRQLPFARVEP